MDKLSFLIVVILLAACSSSNFMPPGHEKEVAVTQKAKNSTGEVVSYIQISANYGISSKHGVDILRDNGWHVIEHPTCDLAVFAHKAYKGQALVEIGDMKKNMDLIAREPKTRTRAWGIHKIAYKAHLTVTEESCPYYQLGSGKIKRGNSGAGIWTSKGKLAGMALGRLKRTDDVFFLELKPLGKWIEINGKKAVNTKPKYRYKSLSPAVIQAPFVSQ